VNGEGKTPIVKAMILAAGLGTRLRPLTSSRPKALVPVGNRPVIDRVIGYLKGYDITEIIVNAHHFPHQILRHLDGGRPFGLRIDVRIEREILGTGGGIKNVSDFWDRAPFVVINGDILTDIDLGKAYETHCDNQNLATLVLHDYAPFNQVQVDDRMNITAINQEPHPAGLAFTGIHIMEPELLAHIPEGVFSNIIDCYRRLITSGRPIRAHISERHYWRDIGSIRSYLLANKECLTGEPFSLGPNCLVPSSARLNDWAVIGEETHLGEGVEITRSVLWEKVEVKKGVRVIDSVITSSRKVESDQIGKVL
jgi:mannose-1-phosphate guanylyltransferase